MIYWVWIMMLIIEKPIILRANLQKNGARWYKIRAKKMGYRCIPTLLTLNLILWKTRCKITRYGAICKHFATKYEILGSFLTVWSVFVSRKWQTFIERLIQTRRIEMVFHCSATPLAAASAAAIISSREDLSVEALRRVPRRRLRGLAC